MRSTFAAVVLALVLCTPVEAATTVARSGDFTLHATERGDRLCMTLRRDRRYRGEACGRIPRSPHRPLAMFPDVGWSDYAAAVPPSVRFAETESRDGRRERHRTSGARGFPARFVILPAPPAAMFVRYYGAGGRLLAVDAGPAGYISLDDETPLADGVEAHTEPQLEPAPDDPGRLATIACVDVETAVRGGSFCDDRAGSGLVLLSACQEPHAGGALLAAGVAAVRLTLGSGVEATLPAVDLPAVFGGRRAAAGRVPAGEAVRDAVALDAAGAVVGRASVGMAPGGQPCAGEDQGGDSFGGSFVPVAPPAGAAEVASAGGESLLAADQGETLCVGLAPLRPANCPPPPVDSDRPRLHWRNGVVAGVLSQDAARITLRVEGDDVTVGTTDGSAYGGRWAGFVRFFAARVGDRKVTGAVVRNARGRIIGLSRAVLPRPRWTATVLAERDGRGVRLLRKAGRQPCLTALAAGAPRFCTDLDPGTLIDGPYLPYGGAISVPCAPRLATAYGRMPDHLKPPMVLLAGGETVPARRIRLRGEDGWVAFVPDIAVRGLRAGRYSVPLALPPASEQCGYSLARSF